MKTAVVAGIFALLGTIAGATITGWSDYQLARQKHYSSLVLKALEADSGEERLETLALLTETNLISEKDVKQGVADYVAKKISKPDTVPQVRRYQPASPSTSDIIESLRQKLSRYEKLLKTGAISREDANDLYHIERSAAESALLAVPEMTAYEAEVILNREFQNTTESSSTERLHGSE